MPFSIERRAGECFRILKGPSGKAVFTTLQERKEFIEDIHDALYASKIISYAQGFSLMKAASQTYGWDLDYGSIALLWRGGCIIRSQFLSNIKEAYDKEPKLGNLMLDELFHERTRQKSGWMEEDDSSRGKRRDTCTCFCLGVDLL